MAKAKGKTVAKKQGGAKAQATSGAPRGKKQTAVLTLEEIINTPRAENPFALEAFMARFKYRVGKPHIPSNFSYAAPVKHILSQCTRGHCDARTFIFPALAFAVLRQNK